MIQEREMSMRCRIFKWPEALCAALAVTVASPNAFADPEPQVAEIGQPAPAFSVQTRDRIWQSWTDFKGERGLVFVFATAEKLSEVKALAAELSENDLPILVIDVTCGRGPRETCPAYRDHAPGLSVRYDPKGAVAALYGIPGVPYVVAVDSDLIIRVMGGVGRNADETAALARAFQTLAHGEAPAVTGIPVDNAAPFRPNCGREVR